jgi:hypothetical protein
MADIFTKLTGKICETTVVSKKHCQGIDIVPLGFTDQIGMNLSVNNDACGSGVSFSGSVGELDAHVDCDIPGGTVVKLVVPITPGFTF